MLRSTRIPGELASINNFTPSTCAVSIWRFSMRERGHDCLVAENKIA
jgi:hypothetical protein